jgi:hypothetical protein
LRLTRRSARHETSIHSDIAPIYTPTSSPHQIPSTHLDANEEALLALLRLDPRTLENRIRARNTDALWCRRADEVQDVGAAELRASGLERVADREEDAGSHEERWFTWGIMLAQHP